MHRVQITRGALNNYKSSVLEVFGNDVDYATLEKRYVSVREGPARYSPPVCIGCRKVRRIGKPNPDLISTSYVERQNLTHRTQNRRLTRLANSWSRILSNHVYATAPHFWSYNFQKKHSTLKSTPAVAAGISDRPMTGLDFVDMLEAREAAAGGRLMDCQLARATQSEP